MKDLVLQTVGLTKQYGAQFAVHQLNLHVERGQIYGLLGRNGAGKTTTLRMVTGLLQPTEGEIYLFGEKMTTPTKAVFGRIGALIESPAFYENLTARENLKIIADLRGTQSRHSIEEALKLVNLDQETKKRVRQFSLGMKQRLGIAMAMMHNPEFIILDEPTNGLDPMGIQQIRLLIKKLSAENGVTVLISSHILSEIEQMADTVGIIDKGILVEELTMEEIHHRNRHYVKLRLSDISQSIPLLEKQLGISDFEIVGEQEVKLFQLDGNLAEINRVLVTNGIGVRVSAGEFLDGLGVYALAGFLLFVCILPVMLVSILARKGFLLSICLSIVYALASFLASWVAPLAALLPIDVAWRIMDLQQFEMSYTFPMSVSLISLTVIAMGSIIGILYASKTQEA